MSFLKTLWRWLGDGTATAVATAPPTIHDVGLDALLGEKQHATRIARAAAFLPEVDEGIVRGVARAFLGHVVDLPASQNHHHAEPFGLFDHSLDVAEIALRAAQSEQFVATTDAYPEEQEYRLWRLRFAVWFFALHHDAGKVASVLIHGPAHSLWNPYEEPLEAFYGRHGREQCAMTWRVERRMNDHACHTAHVTGRLLTPDVARLFGSRIATEVLEDGTLAAKAVHALITDADHRSTREALARKAKALEEARVEALPAVLPTAKTDFVGELARILVRGIAEGVFRVNALDADLWVGEKHLALRYPQGLQKLVFLVRDLLGRECSEARALPATEDGARALANALHGRRRLAYDVETDGWKMIAKITIGERFEVAEAVLLQRSFIEPALAMLGGLALFDGAIAFARAADGKAVPHVDFRRDASLLAPVAPAPAVGAPAAAAPTPAPAPPPPSLPPPQPAPSPAPPVQVGSPVPAVRKFIVAEQLLDDLRDAILSGAIPTNQFGGQAYVLEDVTYLVSPRCFQRLVEKGLYQRDPQREVNAYLDALAKLPCVRKGAVGRLLSSIQLRHGARPMWVVVIDTNGLFRDAKLLARVGYWTGSAIKEITEDEHHRLVASIKLEAQRKSTPPVSAPTEMKPGGTDAVQG